MPTHLADRDPTLDVDCQAAAHEVVHLGRHANARCRQAADFSSVGVGEGYLARDENAEEHAKRPDFARRGFVELAAEDFRRREGRRAVEACRDARISTLRASWSTRRGSRW